MASPEELKRLATALDRLLTMSGPEQNEFLDRLAEEDVALAERLHQLLELRDQSVAVDGQPWRDLPPHRPGVVIGPYRLLRPIGEGGMGSVWLAERVDESLKRVVALKLPLSGLHAGVLARRFERERDILSALAHPNIARLYDAGVSNGQAYLALEYIDGVPITVHCAERSVDTAGRVALIRQVLGALQAAHSKLVIHRDLKPSNILVTAQGDVKLLDFGIAKLLDKDDRGGAVDTELTLVGGRAMTPAYASPEQLEGRPLGTTSDIYSLGILLYELLAGQRPLDAAGSRQLDSAGIHVTLGPLRFARTSGEHGDHRTRAMRTARGVSEELDLIALKALKTDPGLRYASAGQFADDLASWLAGDPVKARPDSAAYRLRKFATRHRVAVMTGMIGVLATGISIGYGVQQASDARAAMKRADDENQLAARFVVSAEHIRGPVAAAGAASAPVFDVGNSSIYAALASNPDAGQVRVQALRMQGVRIAHELKEHSAQADVVPQTSLLVERLFGDRAVSEPWDALLLAAAHDWLSLEDHASASVVVAIDSAFTLRLHGDRARARNLLVGALDETRDRPNSTEHRLAALHLGNMRLREGANDKAEPMLRSALAAASISAPPALEAQLRLARALALRANNMPQEVALREFQAASSLALQPGQLRPGAAVALQIVVARTACALSQPDAARSAIDKALHIAGSWPDGPDRRRLLPLVHDVAKALCAHPSMQSNPSR
jgi:serine/threonine protein kinase